MRNQTLCRFLYRSSSVISAVMKMYVKYWMRQQMKSIYLKLSFNEYLEETSLGLQTRIFRKLFSSLTLEKDTTSNKHTFKYMCAYSW